MNNLLVVPEHKASQFAWKGTTGCAEVSELTDGGSHGFEGRIYADACDIGFTVVSDRTGRRITFALVSTERDADNDVAMWKYRGIGRDSDFVIIVFND
jgi:hypothetical protein